VEALADAPGAREAVAFGCAGLAAVEDLRLAAARLWAGLWAGTARAGRCLVLEAGQPPQRRR
jgi:hypothetical protein